MMPRVAGSGRRRAAGFTLIELMISMLLGLLVVGSVIGVLLANKRSSGTNQGLSQVQESARTAYEMLAHDIREADGNGCGSSANTANVLVTPGAWWQDWVGLRGYDSSQADPAVPIGTGTGERVAGTDSIRVESIDGAALAVASHVVTPGAPRINVNVAAPTFAAGDIMLVCDYHHSAIFQASAVTFAPGVMSVFHRTGVGAPGNCVEDLRFPNDCTPAVPAYSFPRNAQIGRLIVTDWYIGNNGRATDGGRSLYRRRLTTGGAVLTEEIVAGVTDMQMRFRANADNNIIADASLVPDWNVISSVLITITADSSDANVSVDSAVQSGRIERSFNYLISLRNRLQ